MNSDQKTNQLAIDIAQFLEENRALDLSIIDVSETAGWTDCFVIATVTSLAHLKALARQLWSFLAEKDVEVFNRHKDVSKEGWQLIDCGSIIIHLMSSELREFYNLEKLWHEGKRLLGR